MSSFDASIQKACEDTKIPGAILVASSADGKFRYEKAFGTRSLKDPSPLKTDDTLWIASCSKLMTTVAVMQCVEKGLLGLDDDATTILHELKGREILKGFGDDGKAILIPHKKTITLRYMLTHQSGLSYDVFSKLFPLRGVDEIMTESKDPTLMQYQASIGKTPAFGGALSIPDSYDYPLLFEPGESWEYSVGIDWAGEMVSRVTKLSLEDYMKANIWSPLGMENITFHPKQQPEVLSRLMDMSERVSPLTIFGTAQNSDAALRYTSNRLWKMDSVACHGGAGLYAPPREYQKMLHSICADDGKLLKSASIDEMHKPQLTDAARAKCQELVGFPDMRNMFGGLPKEIKVDWGLGGVMNLNAFPNRSAGSISWSGLPNLIWYIDRKAGISGILGSQILPLGDPTVVALMEGWKTACYRELGVEAREKL